MADLSDNGVPSVEQARTLLEQSRNSRQRARAEGRWVVVYLAAFGLAALILIALGTFVDNGAVDALINGTWLAVLIALPIWSSKRHVTPRGASRRMGVAFLIFGVSYTVTAAIGLLLFQHQLWWWLAGGTLSATPLLLMAFHEARR